MAQDRTPTPDALLEHATFVRRVARSLVRDGPTADDVVQDTWEVAIRKPPRDSGRVRGWLATVARNMARKRARSGRRRRGREAATAKPASCDATDLLAERAETVRHVTDALMRLAPAQRAVVIMRFYEDLPPRTIARRLGISVNTVKSRLRLALGHLRTQLKETEAGDGWRRRVAATFGLNHILATGASGSAVAVATGAFWMTQVKLVGGLVVLATLLWGAHRTLSTPPAVATRADAPEDLVSGQASGPTLVRRRTPLAREAGASSPSPADRDTPEPDAASVIKTPADTLEAVLLLGGAPATEGTGLLWQLDSRPATAGEIPAGAPPTQRVPIERDGVFRFAGLPQGHWMTGVDLGDGVQRLFYVFRSTGLAPNERLTMPLGDAEVLGSVYDETGTIAADAIVRVGSQGQGFVTQTRTDAQGRYHIRQLQPGRAWVSVAYRGDLDDDRQCTQRPATLASGTRVEVSFGSPRGGVRIQGRLTCEDGSPVRGPGRIILDPESRPGYESVAYDEQGRFAQGIPAGNYRVQVWLPSGGIGSFGPQKDVFVAQRDVLDQRWVLRGTRFTGRVRAPGGVPENTYVRFTQPQTSWPTPGRSGARYARVRSDGSFLAYGVLPGRHEASVVVFGGGGTTTPVDLVVVEGAAEVRLDFVLPKQRDDALK